MFKETGVEIPVGAPKMTIQQTVRASTGNYGKLVRELELGVWKFQVLIGLRLRMRMNWTGEGV